MSDFTVLRNGNEADLDRALAWVRGACTSGQEPLVAIIEQAAAAYRTKVVDVPAVPVQPAPNYRIQIEDGAWVGSQYAKRVLAARPAPEYAVVTSDYADMLARDVSALMVEGWELQGGISARYFNDGMSSWAQAMVRK